MKELKPIPSQKIDGHRYFNPMSIDGLKPKCVCGYELLKESDGTLRCSGGRHRYLMDFGEQIIDKNGEVWLKIPSQNENKTGKKQNEKD